MSILCGFNDKKEIKFIDDVIKGETIYCFDCEGKLISKKGEVRKHHFSHSIESDCMGESWEHKYSKEFIARNIHKIYCVEKCRRCHNPEEEEFTNCYVILEHGYKGYVIDCAIFNLEGEFICAIEIYNTHKTEREKINTIKSDGIGFYEISTNSIIKNKNNFVFNNTYHDFICNKCIQKEEKEKEREKEKEKEIIEVDHKKNNQIMCGRNCYTCEKVYWINFDKGFHIMCCEKCRTNCDKCINNKHFKRL